MIQKILFLQKKLSYAVTTFFDGCAKKKEKSFIFNDFSLFSLDAWKLQQCFRIEVVALDILEVVEGTYF